MKQKYPSRGEFNRLVDTGLPHGYELVKDSALDIWWPFYQGAQIKRSTMPYADNNFYNEGEAREYCWIDFLASQKTVDK